VNRWCTLSDGKLSIADGGRTRIKDHTNTKKHIKSLADVKSNQSINAFLAVDPFTMQLQGEELTFAMNPDAAFDETLLISQFVFENLSRWNEEKISSGLRWIQKFNALNQ
jgi:hypothetical protein